jgi:hypothetical protein
LTLTRMVGTGAPAGASASGLRFCTSIPPGRTSHSSSFTAAEAGGGELSLIASANVPLGLARIIFSWCVHAPRDRENQINRSSCTHASNSNQERASRVSSALLGCPRNDLWPPGASRGGLGGAGSGEDGGARFAAAASAGASSRVSASIGEIRIKGRGSRQRGRWGVRS